MSPARGLARARHHYEERRRRDAVLAQYGDAICGQMWDILLGLAIVHHEKRPIPDLELPRRIRSDPNEGVRCVAVLRKLGLVERRDGQEGHLLHSVRLSKKGTEVMARALAAS